jgi:hypothetical protein
VIRDARLQLRFNNIRSDWELAWIITPYAQLTMGCDRFLSFNCDWVDTWEGDLEWQWMATAYRINAKANIYPIQIYTKPDDSSKNDESMYAFRRSLESASECKWHSRGKEERTACPIRVTGTSHLHHRRVPGRLLYHNQESNGGSREQLIDGWRTDQILFRTESFGCAYDYTTT